MEPEVLKILIICFTIIFAGIALYIIVLFNSLVALKNSIRKAWANIDVLLKQRYDELPNLIETVKGYMKHEKALFESITKARSALMTATTRGKKAKADNIITESLKSVFAVAENYPKLRANENFLRLQERISGIENELADRREFFNDTVTSYNTRIQSFPDFVIANMLSYKEEQLFRAEEGEKAVVKAKF
jgi:LemA protein